MLRCRVLVRPAWKFGNNPKRCCNKARFSSSPTARIPQANQDHVASQDDQSVLGSHSLVGKELPQKLLKGLPAMSSNETSTAIPKSESRSEEAKQVTGLKEATDVAMKEEDRKESSVTSTRIKCLLQKLRSTTRDTSEAATTAIDSTHKASTRGSPSSSIQRKDGITGSLQPMTDKDSKTVRSIPPSRRQRKSAIKAAETPTIRKFPVVTTRRLPGSPLIRKHLSDPESKLIKSALLTTRTLKMEALEVTGQPPVKNLSYDLDRVLFKQGVYNLQDPRTGVFNFDHYLQNIMPEEEFDFDSLARFMASSEDTTLQRLAKEHGKKYVGSTSSMTSVLSHFHFLLSNFRPLNLSRISRAYPEPSTTFTEFTRLPASIYLKYKDGAYAVDSNKEFDRATILSRLGQSLEKLLTVPKNLYEQYRKTSSEKIPDEVKNTPEAYHYSSLGNFVFRSQLDGHHGWLPGSGVFDIKTRACITIRMNQDNYKEMSGYQIRGLYGEWESYEREYLDMLRSTMLKYSLQVRMGRMDGIFVAYHNTEQIFGFQYIPLSEMDLALHGQENLALGDQEFKFSVQMFSDVLDLATERFPSQSIRFYFETRPRIAGSPEMYIFAEPMDTETMDTVQQAESAIALQELRNEMLGDNSPPKTDGAKEKATEASEDLRGQDFDLETELEESIEASSNMEAVQTEIEPEKPSQDPHIDAGDPPDESNAITLEATWSSSHQTDPGDIERPLSPPNQSIKEPDEAKFPTAGPQLQQSSKMESESGIDISEESQVKQRPILGMCLSASNLINGDLAEEISHVNYAADWPLQQVQWRYAKPANGPKVNKLWNVSYHIRQFSDREAQGKFRACKERKRKKYAELDATDKYHEKYLRILRDWSERGRSRKKRSEKVFRGNSMRQFGD